MEWVLYSTGGWKAHWCPLKLLSGLMQDAGERGQQQGTYAPARKGMIDLPGMIMADRTYQEFDLDGFTLTIPTEDVEHYFNALKEAPRRTFGDGQAYYKVHGWIHCLVLTDALRDTLLERMGETMPAVKKKAEEERAEFRRRIADINGNGVRVISMKAPDSIPKVPMSGKKNEEKN